MIKKELDGIDLKILRILQDEGRISNLDVYKKIGMSPPPTLRRVRDLEKKGFIDGFRANLDPSKLGYDLTAWIFISLKNQNEITKVTPASFEPTIDYVVTKIPRFTFEKFQLTKPLLTSSMKSVGEVMAIGRSFNESLQKALRSLEIGLCGLDEITYSGNKKKINKNNIINELKKPLSDRILLVGQALRMGKSIKRVY